MNVLWIWQMILIIVALVKFIKKKKNLFIFYLNFLKIFNNFDIVCTDHCEKCQQNGSLACEICQNDYYLYNNKSLCVPCLDQGQYISGSTCVECGTKCKNCFNETHCSECLPSYIYISDLKQCLDACPMEGYYIETQNNTCIPCDKSCNSCFGPNNSQCFNCKQNYFQFSNSCLEQCPQNTTIQNNSFCVPCVDLCEVCNQNNSNFCEKCQNDFYILEINGKNACDNCSNAGYFVLNSTWCLPCLNNCDLCSSEYFCEKCSEGFFLLEEANNCTKECPTGYFPNNSLNICNKCNENCSHCDQNICFQCDDAHYLYNGMCLEQCPPKTAKLNGICTGML